MIGDEEFDILDNVYVGTKYKNSLTKDLKHQQKKTTKNSMKTTI